MVEAIKPAAEACTCHQQSLLSGWHVPTAVAEVPLVLMQTLLPTLRHDEVMHNLHMWTK